MVVEEEDLNATTSVVLAAAAAAARSVSVVVVMLFACFWLLDNQTDTLVKGWMNQATWLESFLIFPLYPER